MKDVELELELEQVLTEMVAEQAGVDEGSIKPNSILGDDLGLDSVDEIDLILNIEEKYIIELRDDIDYLTMTVTEFIDLVKAVVFVPGVKKSIA